MDDIKPIGSFYRVDHEGYIVNDTSWEKIESTYRNAINRSVNLLTLQLPLHSIYIRGSVPRGNGIEGVSDLDFIVISEQDANEEIIEKVERKLTKEFPWLNGIEVSYSSLHNLNDLDSFTIIPFMLKTSSLCVYGKDITDKLPRYKIDRALANDHLIQLEKHIEQAKFELDGHQDEEDIADCCGWIMKIMVRSGLALVMEYKRRYTRDLYPAYQLFSSIYPHRELDMKQALTYAIHPSRSPEEIVRFLDGFGKWMINEADQWQEEFNPTREQHLPIPRN
ncbi:MAG: nucleotidyltransferase [Anaerobacillus sp.]